MVRKKSPGIRGRVVDIEWKGDDYLSRELSWDYQLKDKLLQAELGELKDGICIFPEPKYEYARVRTSYFLPSLDLFDAIDIMASHICPHTISPGGQSRQKVSHKSQRPFLILGPALYLVFFPYHPKYGNVVSYHLLPFNPPI